MTKREKILTGLCIFQALLVLCAAVFCGLVYIKSTEPEPLPPVPEDVTLKAKNVQNLNAEWVSLVQLMAAPEQYDGKMVTVVGVSYWDRNGYLALSKDDVRYFTHNMVGIELSDEISAVEARKLEGRYVSVTGVFHNEPFGEWGMTKGVIKDICRYSTLESTANRYDLRATLLWEENEDGTFHTALCDLRGNVLYERDVPTMFDGKATQVGKDIMGLHFENEDKYLYDAVYANVRTGEVSKEFQDLIFDEIGEYVLYAEKKRGEFVLVLQPILGDKKSAETFVMEGAIGEDQPVLVGFERPTLDTMIVTYKTEDGEAEIRVSCPED